MFTKGASSYFFPSWTVPYQLLPGTFVPVRNWLSVITFLVATLVKFLPVIFYTLRPSPVPPDKH